MQKIILDLDDVLADTNSHLLRIYNERYGANIQRSDCKEWDLSAVALPGTSIHSIFLEPGFFRYLTPMPGAQEVVKALLDDGNDLLIATAAPPVGVTDKVNWVKEHLPFFPIENFIVAQRKDVLQADYILDDAPHNILTSRCRYPVFYNQPWNERIDHPRVHSLEEFYNMVSKKTSGHIFVLNGPSASGKTTLMEAMLKGYEDIEPVPNLLPIVTVTTRPPRPGEVDGVDYHFVTPEEFARHRKTGRLVEETVYAGVAYGIFDEDIERIKKAGCNAIVVLDMHGISEMKRFYGKDNVTSIFVYRDLEDILTELKKRDIPHSEVIRRFESAKQEMRNINSADHIVYNNKDLRAAVIKCKEIISSNKF